PTHRFYTPPAVLESAKGAQPLGWLDTPALRITSFRVTLLVRAAMNPDKLFDYLDGRLSPKQRADFEEQLMSDKQLQREFTVARQIHSGTRGESREVVFQAPP